jgi:hypothetical protein
MTELKEILKIIKTIRDTINDDTNLVWTRFDSAKELRTELDESILRLESGDLAILRDIKLMFAPTSTFQEISISNDWGQEFIELSGNFARHYEKIALDSN